jgi:hypothetical protein
MQEQEVVLPGGRTTGAVRIGDVVHKPAAPWTPTVHALLRHLAAAGFHDAPRPLGFDAQGREMLTYLPGETIGERFPWPAWAYADETLVQVGRWLRRVHDLTENFSPDGAVWFTGATMQPGFVVGHQDAAPYNAVMDGGRLVGFVDWDIAGPSPREFDLAFSAIVWIPLTECCAHTGGRFHRLLDAYGYRGDRRVFAEVIPQRAERQAGIIRQIGDSALLPMADLLDSAASVVRALPPGFWET